MTPEPETPVLQTSGLQPTFPDLVAEELDSARRHWPPIRGAHEAYAIILEELDEVWGHVKLNPEHREASQLLHELVQVAAMCQRTAEDIGFLSRLIATEPSAQEVAST